MAGRRILDAAALLNASRAVASKHFALRATQLEAYSKTSSLAKAVKGQTDRVTLTVEAASALARRFNEPATSYTTHTQDLESASQVGSVPGKDNVERPNTAAEVKEGLEQDHFYERSDANTTVDPLPDGELGVKQEKAKRHPLPDGSILPAESGNVMLSSGEDVFSSRSQTDPAKVPLAEESGVVAKSLQPESSGRSSIPTPSGRPTQPSAEEAKVLQRQAESQIPAKTAEPPPTGTFLPQTNVSSEAEAAELGVDQEQDVFYSPPTTATAVLSALPRVKVPKFTENAQEGDEHVPDEQINQDVFYSSSRHRQEKPIQESQAVPEQDQPSQDMYAEMFHSPRVAKLLGGRGKRKTTPDSLEMQGAKGTPVDQTSLAHNKDQDTFNVRTSAQEAPKAHEASTLPENRTSSFQAKEEDVHGLAADIAKDADTSSTSGPEVSIQWISRVCNILIH